MLARGFSISARMSRRNGGFRVLLNVSLRDISMMRVMCPIVLFDLCTISGTNDVPTLRDSRL